MGIHRLALHLDLVVQMGSGGPAGIAAQAQDLPPPDLLVHTNGEPREMTVEGLGVVAVIDDQVLAKRRKPVVSG